MTPVVNFRLKGLATAATFAGIIALAAACGVEGDGPAAPGDGTATPVPVSPGLPPATPTPTPSPNHIATVKRPAQIESVSLNALVSDVNQWVLRVEYGLPGGCAKPGGYVIKESFPHQVDVFVELPADPNIACTKEYRIGTYEIPLGGGYEACKEYSTLINGAPFRLQAISPVARCAAPSPGTGQGIISGYDALFYTLQSFGVQVERGEQPKEGFFEFAPRVLKVNGQTVDVYEFATVKEAEDAATRVSADGTTYTRRDGVVQSVQWVAPVRFHLIANTITVYVGGDQNVVEALRNGAGRQFAGDASALAPYSYDHLLSALELAGFMVSPSASASKPLFGSAGRVLMAGGAEVHVFAFDSEAAARKAQERVTLDGAVIGQADGTVVRYDWEDYPHFFRRSNLIAFYVGRDVKLLTALQASLGPQFAGIPSDGVLKPVETPAPAQERVVVDAPIESVEVLFLKSNPVRHVARVVSGLPSGCAKFDGYAIERSGRVIKVNVTNTMPASPYLACTAIYGMVTTDIDLGGGLEQGAEYTLYVNTTEMKFTAQ
jgi:hypothetical protein